MSESSDFRLTAKQREQLRLIGGPATHVLSYGGSRSAKTFGYLRAIAIRALAAPRSRHAVLRFRFNHVKASIVADTWPKMLRLCFPQVPVDLDKTDWYAKFPNESEVWFGGLDDKDRTEKVLGQEYCVSPESLILTADLQWVQADSISVGDELVGFPESLDGHCKLLPSVVERADVIQAERYLIETDRGSTVVSAQHRMVAHYDDRRHRNARQFSWRKAEDLRVGDHLRWTCEPWKVGGTREDGWFSGMLDGEGWVSKPARMAGVAQCEGECLDALRDWLRDHCVAFADRVGHGKQGKRGPCHKLTASGLWPSLRMLGIARPKRLDGRLLWDGCHAFRTTDHTATVVRITKLGIGPVVALGTSTKTFIADGFLAHNCTILLNECSQIPFSSRNIAVTRLAQAVYHDVGGERKQMRLKMLYDCNPPPKGHWTYKLFRERRDPETNQPLKNIEDVDCLQMNPGDNRENLPPGYLTTLEALPARMRVRFLEGEFGEVAEGALWSLETIEKWRSSELPDMQRIVVAVDPSGADDTDNAANDEIGIVVAGLGTDGRGYLLEDLTVKAGPKTWGTIATTAFDRHQADLVVGEKNYGGAMVKYVIQTQRPNTPYKEVTASRGKAVRAEPIAALHESGKVRFAGNFPELEDELCAFTTAGYTGSNSPNRADAFIWAMSELFPGMVKESRKDKRERSVIVPRGPLGFMGA